MESTKNTIHSKVEEISHLVKQKFGMTMTEAISLLKKKGL